MCVSVSCDEEGPVRVGPTLQPELPGQAVPTCGPEQELEVEKSYLSCFYSSFLNAHIAHISL